MSVIALIFAGAAIVISAHSVIFTAGSRFYRRRIETRVFDNPLPWYVRYANWLDRRHARTKS